MNVNQIIHHLFDLALKIERSKAKNMGQNDLNSYNSKTFNKELNEYLSH